MSNVFWKKPGPIRGYTFLQHKENTVSLVSPEKKKAKKKLVMANEHASRQLNFWHQALITGFNLLEPEFDI